MKIHILGTIIIALMISLASCASSQNNGNMGYNQPNTVVMTRPRPNRNVIVVNTNRNRFGFNRGFGNRGFGNRGRCGRGGRVIIIR